MAKKTMNALTHRLCHQLPSGLMILLDPIPDSYTIAIGAFIKTGARYEKISGLAHFLEHMVFKGTKKRSAYAITQEIEQLGGSINAFTAREETAYYVRMMAEDAEKGIDILSDMLSAPLFTIPDLNSEREVVIQEILQSEDDPQDVLFDGLQKVFFPNNHLGEPILGYQDSLQQIHAPELHDFMQDYYSADNIILSVAGKFDSDKIITLIEKYFSELPSKKQGAKFTNATPANGHQHIKRPIEQFHLCLAFPAMKVTDPFYYSAIAFSEIFGETMSSRLFQTIREKLGLAYAVQSFLQCYQDTGIFGIYAATNPPQAEKLQQAIRDELQKIDNDITQEEVEMARKQLLAKLYMGHESLSHRMQHNAKIYHLYEKIFSLEEVTEKINAINIESINNFVKQLQASPESWISVGPQEDFSIH